VSEINEEERCVQEDVMSVDEKTKRISLLSPKEQVRRTVSNDNRLQSQQQQQQLPALTTQSQAKPDFTITSLVSKLRFIWHLLCMLLLCVHHVLNLKCVPVQCSPPAQPSSK